MFEPKNPVPKTTHLLPAAPQARSAEERKQRRMMVIALVLLLVALGFVLYRDCEFWAPDNQETEDQPTPADHSRPHNPNANRSRTTSIGRT